MEFSEVQQRAIDISDRYDDLNQIQRGITWDAQNVMAGFVGDVGDLSKIIMAKHGLRGMENIDAKLEHELADCLWSILVLSEKYGIDLEAAFLRTMDGLEAKISK